MGKDEKEDSGFGFKDKAKAVETLRLLEQHDPNYRRLTVRGLLGRAKRWLADLDANKKTDKPDKKEEKKKEEKKEKKEEKEKSGSDEHADAKLFTEKDEPTAEHLEMLLWAYSPDPARVKKYLPETKEERKRRSSGREDDSPSKRTKQ
ncbi:hypothetical protein HF086_007693 [Spodoptera exigua]|uniref:Uncharacterized protein n=1 Tax=Spodoptera exigua TaxID=7107 RepID=A0A922MVP4_SPOEX|nr:hypothetical protein HF086_007693 [Spodoptera exigua]